MPKTEKEYNRAFDRIENTISHHNYYIDQINRIIDLYTTKKVLLIGGNKMMEEYAKRINDQHRKHKLSKLAMQNIPQTQLLNSMKHNAIMTDTLLRQHGMSSENVEKIAMECEDI